MKERIFKELRTRYANLGLGEKFLTAAAEALSAVVTEEGQLDNAVGGDLTT